MIFFALDESSLSDRGSNAATNSEASGFSSGSGGSTGNRKSSPPAPGALPVPIPPQQKPNTTQTAVGGRSPKPPPLVLTTTNISLSNGNKCNIPQPLNLAGPSTQMTTGARTVGGSRIPPPLSLSIKTEEQLVLNTLVDPEPIGDASADGGLVFITIIPDEQGRFGFNVKGGIDQKLPIIVSRVGSNTPADR